MGTCPIPHCGGNVVNFYCTRCDTEFCKDCHGLVTPEGQPWGPCVCDQLVTIPPAPRVPSGT